MTYLRKCKRECPTCRLHIPSKRYLRKAIVTDELVNRHCSSNISVRAERVNTLEWSRLHEQRTCEIKELARLRRRDMTGAQGVDADRTTCSRDDQTPTVKIHSDDLSPPTKQRKLCNVTDGDLFITLRYIWSFDGYNSEVQSIRARNVTTEAMQELKSRYVLEHPYLVVPATTVLEDIQCYILRMLSTVHDMRQKIIQFGILDPSSEVAAHVN